MLKVAYVCAEPTLCSTRKATIALMWILQMTTLSFFPGTDIIFQPKLNLMSS